MTHHIEQVDAVRKAWQDDPDIGEQADRLHLIPQTTEAANPWRVVGEVSSIPARRKATRLAREVLASAAVEDDVLLEPAIRESDDSLAAEVRRTLRAEPPLQAVRVIDSGERPPARAQPWIGVIASASIIHLGGWVPELSLAALAEGVAWETGACRDVRNLIRYQPLNAHPEQAVADAATTLMREHPRLGDQPIHIDVKLGEATLIGTVSDNEMRQLAESLCWFVPHVRAVDNQLEISGELT
ncbi:MAG: BON domain-containing protein [Lamprobacter sp.]|uniref:BON domain-containing protein n=1 Tax=Lamprobacter sp. TaxID=3100796 RepID=UPI002B260204|nr:BON domain-containing protein [Lamprobacter sp.]MEA3642512.1 BON domain-containing protein [Lamprobacter sp.]